MTPLLDYTPAVDLAHMADDLPPYTPTFEGERTSEPTDTELAARAAYYGMTVAQYKRMIAERDDDE